MNLGKNQTPMGRVDQIALTPALASLAEIAEMAAMIEEMEEILLRIGNTCHTAGAPRYRITLDRIEEVCDEWHEKYRAWENGETP